MRPGHRSKPWFWFYLWWLGKKGKGQHIQRRINSLTKWATYTFSLDVIIGDSWDGEYLIIEVAPVIGGTTWETCYEE